MLPDFNGSCVLGIDTDGGGASPETYTVIPTAKVRTKAIPYIYGKKPVVTLVDGSRILAPREDKYHIDIDIEWSEMGTVKYAALVAFAKSAFTNADTAVVKFYPVANAACTAPDGVHAGITVLVEFTDELIQAVYGADRVRKREAKLALKTSALIAGASLPSWVES